MWGGGGGGGLTVVAGVCHVDGILNEYIAGCGRGGGGFKPARTNEIRSSVLEDRIVPAMSTYQSGCLVDDMLLRSKLRQRCATASSLKHEAISASHFFAIQFEGLGCL